jgi:hypothetical protein
MDDPDIYGYESYRMSFARAIESGLLADYRIAVAVVTDERIHQLTQDPKASVRYDGRVVPAVMLAMRIAVLRAMARYGATRAITYHSRVAEACMWARTLDAAATLLPGDKPQVWSRHVDGSQRAATRRRVIDRLGTDGDEWVIVPNAKVLNEGVDAPDVDIVAVLGLRGGKNTAQAAGHGHGIELDQWLKRRRRDHRRGTLTPARFAALDALGMAWKLKATAAEGRAAAVAFHGAHGHLNVPHGTEVNDVDVYSWLVARRVDLREGRLSAATRDQLDTMGMVWDLRQQQWWDQFAALQRFHEQTGHLRARTNARHDGVVLSRFMLKMRKDREAGRLSATQIAAADALGMRWEIGGNSTAGGRPPQHGPAAEPVPARRPAAATLEPDPIRSRPGASHASKGRAV